MQSLLFLLLLLAKEEALNFLTQVLLRQEI